MDLVVQDHREHIDRLIRAALEAADPAAAVLRAIERQGSKLYAGSSEYDLNAGRVYLVGAGKAAVRMGMAVANMVGSHLDKGILITKGANGGQQVGKSSSVSLPETVRAYEASHPNSDERGIAATTRVIDLLHQTRDGDLVICLISGGASALLTQPRVSLDYWRQLVGALLESGCTINELNAVRKRLDRVKGGGLARVAAPATCLNLILSDVVGNPLDVIGSGPTVSNPDHPATAGSVLRRYNMSRKLQADSWRAIDHQMNLLESEYLPPLPSIQSLIVGDVRQSAEAAVSAARTLGFHTRLLTAYLEGEAREVGRVVAALAKEMAAGSCLILGGETTVTLHGSGLGGRNQELALAAAVALDGTTDTIVASFATDGDDGPTNAAGAIASGETASLARDSGLDPLDYLSRNDSYRFFEQVGGLIVTGPTGTNVNDLIFIMKYGPSD